MLRFLLWDFYTQNKYQLYFDVVNRNKDVTIAKINLYVFDEIVKMLKKMIYQMKFYLSTPVFIRPMQIGVVSFYPDKESLVIL